MNAFSNRSAPRECFSCSTSSASPGRKCRPDPHTSSTADSLCGAQRDRCPVGGAFHQRQPGGRRQAEGHPLGALCVQAHGEAVVEQPSGIVDLALHDGEGPERHPRDAEPRVVELLVQLAYLHQMTKSLIVAPDGNLQFPEGGDGDRRPERLVLIAQVFTAQGRFSQRVVVVDDGRARCPWPAVRRPRGRGRRLLPAAAPSATWRPEPQCRLRAGCP